MHINSGSEILIYILNFVRQCPNTRYLFEKKIEIQIHTGLNENIREIFNVAEGIMISSHARTILYNAFSNVNFTLNILCHCTECRGIT